MSDIDVKTKNILVALENFIKTSSKHFDSKTHDEIMGVLVNHATKVLDSYRGYKQGLVTTSQYSHVLLKLAEVILMAVRRLPG